LETPLFGFLDRLLPGDHHHRHAAERRIGRSRDEIGRTRAERGDAHARLARMTAIGCGHEARALLMSGEDKFNLFGARQAVEEIEILFARHTENILNAFFFEAFDKQVRRFFAACRHGSLLLVPWSHLSRASSCFDPNNGCGKGCASPRLPLCPRTLSKANHPVTGQSYDARAFSIRRTSRAGYKGPLLELVYL
jgi:hypothetical protein